MKTYLSTLAIVLFSITFTTVKGQTNQYLLVTVENSFSMQELRKNEELNVLYTEFDIQSISQAFSNSKKDELKQVFEIRCNCSYNELAQKINEEFTTLLNPEIVEEPELLEHTPNDYNIVFNNDYALNLIEAKKAWDITTGDTSVVIGISDSNFDLNHEEFHQQVNYVQPNINHANVVHGTAVATIAGGATNNNKGKSSIGYNSRLSLHDMSYNGVLHARNKGVQVVNLSWASSCFYVSYHQSVINELFEDGVIVVAAAGNGTTCGGPENLVYPAAYNNVIAVTSIGATMRHEQIEGNINSTHQHNESVDIAAPGYGIAMAFPNNTYGSGTGTSFAAPLVTGTIALMKAVNPAINPCEAEIILKNTATNIDSINEPYEGKLGAGALNAYKAVKLAKEFIPTSIFSEAIPNPNNTHGTFTLLIGGDAPVDDYYADITHTETDSLGNVTNTYQVYITYETGCVFQSTFKDTEMNSTNDSITILPVEDLVLIANQEGENARVSWSTESESNNSHFDLYKSTDGYQWELISSQDGAGNATSRTEYTHLDRELINTIQYYRIHQYDFNGDETISDIVSLSAKNVNELTLYPNPSNGLSKLSSNTTINTVTIIDQTGKVVRELHPASKQVALLTDDLQKGLLYLTIHFENGESETQKLIVL